MNETTKNILFILGIIVVAFLCAKYILPTLFSFLGWAISGLFTIIMWAAIIFLIILVAAYIIRYFKK